MLEKSWIIWLVVFVGSLILETLSMQLFSVWFAVGALAGVLASLLGWDVWLQIVIFVVVTGVSLAATRPLVRRLQAKKPVATGADRYVGQDAVVIEAIDNTRGTGLIKVLGMTWSARTRDGSTIPEGAQVRTVAIQGSKMFVEPK